ncbi:hypothetical protein PSTG_10948 [Puccinia striiformis f. sp. tritici PST-78]|uniref:Uncharacterized protein n=1 Tax=Puccinia striiformis f. sp. tritici PST-78 TaxID=1165861 RepID=A0A0L0V958_9BASI|nr:hypothetical protein PSTG_10948 [Puccinia striiformis f. sp. tritici PST-78]
MAGFSLQQIITPAVCSRYITVGLDHLLNVLDEHPHAKIIWPSREVTARKYSLCIQKKFPRLTKCFGFLDGLNLPVLHSKCVLQWVDMLALLQLYPHVCSRWESHTLGPECPRFMARLRYRRTPLR